MLLPLTEKYRPKKLSDIIGNPNAITQFKKIAIEGNIPHMILTGMPGTGKTTSIICLAKELLKDKFCDAYMELNASDERSIEFIRGKIKNFCKKLVTLDSNQHKIIFLDEAESLTTTSQQALRRIIENYTSTTRFIMASNSSNQIIEAIQSRCVIIRFSKIDNDSMLKRLEEICILENFNYSVDALNNIILLSDGDMRRAINDLQSISNISNNNILLENVCEIIKRPNQIIIEKIIDNCLKNKFIILNKIIEEIILDGYSSSDIIKSLFYYTVNFNFSDQNIKLKYLKEISNTEIYLVNGSDPHLQLLALMAKLCLIINDNN